MITGFDFGTSNCALGVMADDGHVSLLPLAPSLNASPEFDGAANSATNASALSPFMPSTLYALARELICEQVAQNISGGDEQQAYRQQRAAPLAQARRARHQQGFDDSEQSLFFGHQAFEQYFDFPEEGYFVKSPKSFLGASGLRPESLHFFEDIVCAMMQSIKQRGEQHLGKTINHTVIGKPVNFQGLNAKTSNQQALGILTRAAQRAGFKSVEFLFEPIAAGLKFETTLTRDATVLVVDIGGGTTDCAMVRMGPSHQHKLDRQEDFLAHTGERIGGNDLDIHLAAKQLMPHLGMNSGLKNGKPMATKVFWDAVSTNDVNALAQFNSLATREFLKQLKHDASQPELIERLIRLRDNQQNHHLVRSSEQAKIALSSQHQHRVDLNYVEQSLGVDIHRDELAHAIERPLDSMIKLMREAVAQAGTQPELIFITGGSAQSPLIRQKITDSLGDIEILDGDHFGSVAAGLTVWANKIFA